MKKRRGGDLDCGPTFNLLRGTNVLRNLSVAGALTASYQNLDDTILIESDSYARSETYTQAETGAAITAAIDALDLSQFQNEAEVQARPWTHATSPTPREPKEAGSSTWFRPSSPP